MYCIVKLFLGFQGCCACAAHTLTNNLSSHQIPFNYETCKKYTLIVIHTHINYGVNIQFTILPRKMIIK